ncbi:beta-glucosidase [Anaerocolumna xylanovorans]|uniref:Beta-glucosidase n=1 Tax=Anaerocolumna xylanovorans DSM 12503 TaxID=1121345 RepID=A0A1M7Y0Y9_9FIRM|nr:glycoside hydrolase family 3 C-terminal domain-containing protein [Anaerocolumna xylanovorans]SHO45348.1 beta-glucosidase [Anaerocolumna xylanovorans DSM 12503]
MEEKKMNNILGDLSNREKSIITCELWGNISNPLEPYGITKIKCGDSAKPVDFWLKQEEYRNPEDYYCITYPSSAALGAGWNKDNCYKVGQNIGRSSKLHGVDIVCRPGMNIKRSPLCGRNFEYYSEDPVVTGELAESFIRGVQSQGTGACPKHFLCNNQEFERMTTNAVVSERALREIYIRGFQIAIEKGNPWSIMTSYNKVNGEYVTVNKHLMNILRHDLKFDGYVLSDGGAVQSGTAVASHRNGMDMEMGYYHPTEVQNALDSGELSQNAINENIRHIIKTFEKIHSMEATGIENQADEHVLARKIAADCAVLLKNNGILPLLRQEKIAVIGKLAKTPNFMGGGSGFSNAYKLDNTYDEIANILGYQPEYAAAYDLAENPDEEMSSDMHLISEAVEKAKLADKVIFFTGIPYGYEVEGMDRKGFSLPSNQIEAMNAVIDASVSVIVVNVSGASVEMTGCIEASAILHSYPAGESMGGAIADVLFGIAEPGGRLSETFPVRIQDTPAFLNYVSYPQVRENVLYGEDIFVGYRWYEMRDIKPIFPFGYGLSYSEFEYSNASINRSELTPDSTVTLSLFVKNIGTRSASQVIQVYVAQEKPKVLRPIKELKGFEKVFLNPGEEQEVSLTLDRKAFEYFSEEQNRWIVESGSYHILIAINSEEIISSMQIEIKSKDKSHLFHFNSACERLFKEERIKEACSFLPEDKQRFFIPDKNKDLILASPFAYAVPIYHAIEDDSMMIGDKRLTNQELSQVISNLNNV